MRISPLHRTRKTVDFGHIIFKNQSRLHEEKLKKKQDDWQLQIPIDLLHYNGYLCMALIDKRNLS